MWKNNLKKKEREKRKRKQGSKEEWIGRKKEEKIRGGKWRQEKGENEILGKANNKVKKKKKKMKDLQFLQKENLKEKNTEWLNLKG